MSEQKHIESALSVCSVRERVAFFCPAATLHANEQKALSNGRASLTLPPASFQRQHTTSSENQCSSFAYPTQAEACFRAEIKAC